MVKGALVVVRIMRTKTLYNDTRNEICLTANEILLRKWNPTSRMKSTFVRLRITETQKLFKMSVKLLFCDSFSSSKQKLSIIKKGGSYYILLFPIPPLIQSFWKGVWVNFAITNNFCECDGG